MPPREPKGRYLVREYMADADFHRQHDAVERELYLMLALFADDAGWLEWDPEYLMFNVYRYAADRVERFEAAVAALVRTKRLRIFKCGHALMPKVNNWPRSGGQERRVLEDHEAHCPSGRKSTRSRLEVDPSQPELTRPPNLTQPRPHLTRSLPTSSKKSLRQSGNAREGSGAPESVESFGAAMERLGYKGPKP